MTEKPKLSEVPSIATQPNAHVIELLKEILRRAEAGEVQGVAVCYLGDDGGTGTAFQGCAWHVPAILGGLSMLKARILYHHVEMED